jgi:hypothetical protein
LFWGTPKQWKKVGWAKLGCRKALIKIEFHCQLLFVIAPPSRIISIQDHTSMSNEVEEEKQMTNSLSSGAFGTEHPSSPTPIFRKKDRKYGSDLTDSAKKRKRQEHNRKSNERKKN